MANKFLNLVRHADAKALGGFSAKTILMWIADQANAETGLAWPGDEKLARDAGCTVRTVRTATKKLRACGAIEEFRAPVSGAGLARVFRMRESVLKSLPKTFKAAAPIAEDFSPNKAATIGEKFSPKTKRSDEVGTPRWGKIAEAIGANDDVQQVQAATAMGEGISPLPLLNPNLKPPRQPEGRSRSTKEALERLEELYVMTCMNYGSFEGDEGQALVVEAQGLAAMLKTDRALDVLKEVIEVRRIMAEPFFGALPIADAASDHDVIQGQGVKPGEKTVPVIAEEKFAAADVENGNLKCLPEDAARKPLAFVSKVLPPLIERKRRTGTYEEVRSPAAPAAPKAVPIGEVGPGFDDGDYIAKRNAQERESALRHLPIWIKGGKRRWNSMAYGTAPGTTGSHITAAMVHDCEIELGVRCD